MSSQLQSYLNNIFDRLTELEKHVILPERPLIPRPGITLPDRPWIVRPEFPAGIIDWIKENLGSVSTWPLPDININAILDDWIHNHLPNINIPDIHWPVDISRPDIIAWIKDHFGDIVSANIAALIEFKQLQAARLHYHELLLMEPDESEFVLLAVKGDIHFNACVALDITPGTCGGTCYINIPLTTGFRDDNNMYKYYGNHSRIEVDISNIQYIVLTVYKDNVLVLTLPIGGNLLTDGDKNMWTVPATILVTFKPNSNLIEVYSLFVAMNGTTDVKSNVIIAQYGIRTNEYVLLLDDLPLGVKGGCTFSKIICNEDDVLSGIRNDYHVHNYLKMVAMQYYEFSTSGNTSLIAGQLATMAQATTAIWLLNNAVPLQRSCQYNFHYNDPNGKQTISFGDGTLYTNDTPSAGAYFETDAPLGVQIVRNPVNDKYHERVFFPVPEITYVSHQRPPLSVKPYQICYGGIDMSAVNIQGSMSSVSALQATTLSIRYEVDSSAQSAVKTALTRQKVFFKNKGEHPNLISETAGIHYLLSRSFCIDELTLENDFKWVGTGSMPGHQLVDGSTLRVGNVVIGSPNVAVDTRNWSIFSTSPSIFGSYDDKTIYRTWPVRTVLEINASNVDPTYAGTLSATVILNDDEYVISMTFMRDSNGNQVFRGYIPSVDTEIGVSVFPSVQVTSDEWVSVSKCYDMNKQTFTNLATPILTCTSDGAITTGISEYNSGGHYQYMEPDDVQQKYNYTYLGARMSGDGYGSVNLTASKYKIVQPLCYPHGIHMCSLGERIYGPKTSPMLPNPIVHFNESDTKSVSVRLCGAVTSMFMRMQHVDSPSADPTGYTDGILLNSENYRWGLYTRKPVSVTRLELVTDVAPILLSPVGSVPFTVISDSLAQQESDIARLNEYSMDTAAKLASLDARITAVENVLSAQNENHNPLAVGLRMVGNFTSKFFPIAGFAIKMTSNVVVAASAIQDGDPIRAGLEFVFLSAMDVIGLNGDMKAKKKSKASKPGYDQEKANSMSKKMAVPKAYHAGSGGTTKSSSSMSSGGTTTTNLSRRGTVSSIFSEIDSLSSYSSRTTLGTCDFEMNDTYTKTKVRGTAFSPNSTYSSGSSGRVGIYYVNESCYDSSGSSVWSDNDNGYSEIYEIVNSFTNAKLSDEPDTVTYTKTNYRETLDAMGILENIDYHIKAVIAVANLTNHNGYASDINNPIMLTGAGYGYTLRTLIDPVNASDAEISGFEAGCNKACGYVTIGLEDEYN